MPLRDLPWQAVYRTDENDMLGDLYIPALSNSIVYKRAVGFFSAAVLASAAQGLSSFIAGNGRIQLVIGHPLERDEFEAIENGAQLKEIGINPIADLERALTEDVVNLTNYRLRILAWLIACNRLELKFALRKKGMYHEKIGIFEDEIGDKIIFHGSANESINALTDINAESISLYPSWTPSFESHGYLIANLLIDSGEMNKQIPYA